MENQPNARDAIATFLDDEGKIKTWPSKHAKKRAVLVYLCEKFDEGRSYTEREVNVLIEAWHTFGDLFLLRRGLIEAGLLSRTDNGAVYTRPSPGAALP